jgi:hypothetical protein
MKLCKIEVATARHVGSQFYIGGMDQREAGKPDSVIVAMVRASFFKAAPHERKRQKAG